MEYIKADNELCMLALLQMIISDVKGELVIDQNELAEIFGVTIYKNSNTNIKNVSYTDNLMDIGVHIDENKLLDLFIKYDIPLNVKYYSRNPFDDYGLEDITESQINVNKYVVFTYSYGSLYDKPEWIKIGHVGLLENFIDTRTIRMYDPGPDDSGIKEIDLFKMYEAIEKRNGGVYIFSAIDGCGEQ